MRWTIPVYFESGHAIEGEPNAYLARPLFFPKPARAEGDLDRLHQKLTVDLQKELLRLSRSASHEALSAWTFSPPIDEQRLDVAIELRRRVARGRFYFAIFPYGDRRIGFCPRLPDLWFEVCRGQTLENRAAAVLTEHYRRREREADEGEEIRPEREAIPGTAWTAPLEFDVALQQSFKPPVENLFALLGGQEVRSGAEELWTCGRCLNWLYPNGLDRALYRDKESSRLEQLLTAPDRRPILLLGRRQVGKTAIVHEVVHRITARRHAAFANKNNVWLLSPQRLVSGMSFVGQWESRLLAILKEARRRHHVLYFDDFLGLYLAGRSRDSDLNMATVLKPHLERRDCRFLAEMTPEAWRVLRERDRGLADQFEVLPVEEVTADDTVRVLLAVRRDLEQRSATAFDIDALPAVMDLQRRYGSDAAFPGKAVRFVKDLALRGTRREITRDAVLDAFHTRSGLTTEFLDPRKKVLRKDIVEALQRDVVGQPLGIAAVADVLTIAKSRLNDLRRPLGTLLFLGPTGVGKTQLARAAAKYLFGDANRLLRFDLNEYVDSGSAARLMGTFAEPDGLLTSAVRRQPFAVILFDEVEKAHGEVFDLLLQVLGDGRLSDSLGRTVSFANTLVVLTSNLGVREAEGSVGFLPRTAGDHTWQKAAERFFRPEFFNRLDRIVPFGKLSASVVSEVARLALQEILDREGLSRRRCLLSVDPHVLDVAAQRGSVDAWGARGLKRSLERELIQPLARRLSEIRPDAITRVALLEGPAGLLVDIHPLEEVSCPPGCVATYRAEGAAWIEQAQTFAVRVESELAEFRPQGPISAGAVQGVAAEYFLLRDRVQGLKQQLQAAKDAGRKPTSGEAVPTIALPPSRRLGGDTGGGWRQAFAAHEQFHEMLSDLWQQSTPAAPRQSCEEVLRQCALLQVELESVIAMRQEGGSASLPRGVRVGLLVLPHSQADNGCALALLHLYEAAFRARDPDPDAGDCGVEVVSLCDGVQPQARRAQGPGDSWWGGLELSGLAASAVARLEAGAHVWLAPGGRQHAMVVHAFEWSDDLPWGDAATRELARRDRWRSDLKAGSQTMIDDPMRPMVLVRLYEGQGLTLDFRTSAMIPSPLPSRELRQFLLNSLPLPPEFLLNSANIPGER